jgi:hypothetical protein
MHNYISFIFGMDFTGANLYFFSMIFILVHPISWLGKTNASVLNNLSVTSIKKF